MSVKSVNQNPNIVVKRNNHQPNFTGSSFNPVVTLMDAIDKGGFAASFIAQDGIGMVAPRIYEGLNRNRQKDENGKKTGPLNWEFARREGIREILSGPSAFLIPMGMMAIIKKTSGSANNVHVNHIEALGKDFVKYANANREQLADARAFKKGYYAQVFENALANSTDNALKGEELKKVAQDYADKLVEVETLRANKDKKGAKKVYSQLIENYTNLRKSTVSASSNELGVVMTVEGKKNPLGSNIKKLTESLTDYTNDALDKTNKFIKNNANGSIEDFIKNFNIKRAGTRVLSNLSMWGAVVAFYTLIPKLYNLGIKHDPGLKGLGTEEQPKDKKDKTDDKKSKDVAFTGLSSKVGEVATKENGKISKLLSNFEFNGASMTVPAMLTLLFGFCLPPRYLNAKSDKERKEILVRDISSFTAILFGAKALSRGFSGLFAKQSGLALNIKPKDHDKSFFHKIKNYISAGDGIEVLSSDQIVTKYSKIDGYKNGINGFFEFLQENGGNVKKVLSLDKTVEQNAEKIMKDFGGKSLKDATLEEIHEAFKKAKGSDALERIYEIFSSDSNKFINRAKTLNSAFGFASTLILVPAFMMWLARYCEKMTKKAVEKEMAAKQQQNVEVKMQNFIPTNKPTMAGFLNNS